MMKMKYSTLFSDEDWYHPTTVEIMNNTTKTTNTIFMFETATSVV